VERATAAIEPLARKRLQVMEIVMPAEPVMAYVDANRLEQALLNLLSNAHKYSFEASLIWLKLERLRSQLVITVADDGPGIPEDDRECLPAVLPVAERSRAARARNGPGPGDRAQPGGATCWLHLSRKSAGVRRCLSGLPAGRDMGR
jgi:K+-sensing histidine kinase KdpD